MVNLVASPTRGARILDVLVTNLHTAYDKAQILPPIQPGILFWSYIQEVGHNDCTFTKEEIII